MKKGNTTLADMQGQVEETLHNNNNPSAGTSNAAQKRQTGKYKIFSSTTGLKKNEFNHFTSLSLDNVVQNRADILKGIKVDEILQLYQDLKNSDGFVPVANGIYGWLTIFNHGFVLTFGIPFGDNTQSCFPVIECIGAYDDSCADQLWDRVIDLPIVYPHSLECRTHRPEAPYICDMIIPMGQEMILATQGTDWTADAFRTFASLIFDEFEKGTLA